MGVFVYFVVWFVFFVLKTIEFFDLLNNKRLFHQTIMESGLCQDVRPENYFDQGNEVLNNLKKLNTIKRNENVEFYFSLRNWFRVLLTI